MLGYRPKLLTFVIIVKTKPITFTIKFDILILAASLRLCKTTSYLSFHDFIVHKIAGKKEPKKGSS